MNGHIIYFKSGFEILYGLVFKHPGNFLNSCNKNHKRAGDRFFEVELADEIVYPLTLRPALEALERVYRLNINLSFKEHKWKFLQEMIEEYLKLI